MSLPPPVDPTDENVITVKKNIKNLQKFNDQLYMYTISKCANAFLLLEKTDDQDPGMQIGINLLCGGIIGIGSEFGILGCVAANYFCGLIAEYSTTKPPSLTQQLTSYITRIQATSLQADCDLSENYDNPVSNWYTEKSGSFDSPWGKQTISCCLGQFATISFPDETNALFQQMMEKAIFSFDQSLWWVLLNRNFQINGWNSGWLLPPIIQASDVPNGDAGMNNYCSNYMLECPAHWSFWGYDAQTDKKGRDTSYYILWDYSLGSEPKKGKDMPISDSAANYLFIDTIETVIVNPNGLFHRLFVFNDFGLKKVEQVS